LDKTPQGKKSIGRTMCGWEYNITMNLGEVGWEYVDWVDVA